jgi:hypothetical protein
MSVGNISKRDIGSRYYLQGAASNTRTNELRGGLEEKVGLHCRVFSCADLTLRRSPYLLNATGYSRHA